MSGSTLQRTFKTLLDIQPVDPEIKRISEWLPANRGFYLSFLVWLKATGFSSSTISTYAVAARQALGFLDKPYWVIDPEADLAQVWEYLQSRPTTPSTQDGYRKGLKKLSEYLQLRCHRPPKPKEVNWDYYLASLPEWLQEDIRQLVAHCRRNWKPERQVEATRFLLCDLTLSLRWMARHYELTEISDLTPRLWFAYVDQRLADGISPKTLNRELARLKHLTLYLREHERTICERFLQIDYLRESANLPKDVPLEQLRLLQQEIQEEAASNHAGKQRAGRMDLAWFLLMLHSGLRTGEVRALQLGDIDWPGKRVRLEQAKGLQDRLVCLSQATIEALHAYLEVRGPADALPGQVFLYAHKPLSISYCYERLRTYGRRCGVSIRPHQLRHSCATLLLNAGAPVLTVQNILGHKWVDTTLGYARLYDGTVAADYYGAMAVIEREMAFPEDRQAATPSFGELLALVDSLRIGMLKPNQAEKIRQLRAGILALADRENASQDVKVLAPSE